MVARILRVLSALICFAVLGLSIWLLYTVLQEESKQAENDIDDDPPRAAKKNDEGAAKPVAPPAVVPRGEAIPGTYEALQAELEKRVPGLMFSIRAGGAPGMMFTDAEGKFGIVIGSDDPVGTERALEKEARAGWKLCRWGRFHFVGQPEVITAIAKAAGVAARDVDVAAPPAAPAQPAGPAAKAKPQDDTPPAEPRLIPPAIAALIERIMSKDAKEKIAALKAVAALGIGAEEASRAVCACLLDTRRDVAREALHALDKINHDLYEPVKTLIVDNNPHNHADALVRLGGMRERGAGSTPVVVAYIRSTLVRGGSLGPQSLAHQAQMVLLEVARDDGELLDDVMKTARNLPNTELSAIAYRHLGFIGRAHPQHAKRIVAQCRVGLKRESQIVEPITALGCIGPPAAEAVPELQALYDAHPNSGIRDAAGAALRKIGKTP